MKIDRLLLISALLLGPVFIFGAHVDFGISVGSVPPPPPVADEDDDGGGAELELEGHSVPQHQVI